MKNEISYDDAIKHFGGAVALAAALGITSQAVYLWNGKIPKLRQYEILEIMQSEAA